MPVISRIAFSLAGFPVYWYGITMAAAIAAGVITAALRERRIGLPKDTAINLSLLCVPLALIGARAYYVVFSWTQYAADPLSVFDFRSGGLAVYGAVIGGLITGFCYARFHGLPFMKLCDLAAPGIAIGQAIGRWGNFFNQEAYGIAAGEKMRWFPASVFIENDGAWHLAAFFYESVWCLAVFIFLLIKERKRNDKEGNLFLWYVLLYAFERMLLEGIRTDSLFWGSVRVSQLLSAAAAVFAGIMLIHRKRRK